MALRDTHPFTYHTKRLYLLTTGQIDDALKPYGLARSQWAVLANVARAGELGQKDLLAFMRVEPATLTGIIDVLVAKGWLERLENPADKRMKTLRFTEDGRKRWTEIPDPVAIVERRMFAGVPEDAIAATQRTMEQMIANLGEVETK